MLLARTAELVAHRLELGLVRLANRLDLHLLVVGQSQLAKAGPDANAPARSRTAHTQDESAPGRTDALVFDLRSDQFIATFSDRSLRKFRRDGSKLAELAAPYPTHRAQGESSPE